MTNKTASQAQEIGHVGNDLGSGFQKAVASHPMARKPEEEIDYTLTDEEQEAQRNEFGKDQNRLYIPSVELHVTDPDLIKDWGGKRFHGHEALLHCATIEENPLKGRFKHLIENAAIADEEMTKAYLVDFYDRFPKNVRFNVFHLIPQSRQKAQQSLEGLGAIKAAEVEKVNRIYADIDRVQHINVISQGSAAVASVEKSGKDRNLWSMILDCGDGETSISVVPTGHISEQGPSLAIEDKITGRRIGGRELSILLLEELHDKGMTHYSIADTRRMLSQGYGTVKENDPRLQNWLYYAEGGETLREDLSGPMAYTCKRMVVPTADNIQELFRIAGKLYAGKGFGQYEKRQMLSRIYVYGQNSQLDGFVPALKQELKNRKVDANFLDIPNKRFGAAEGGKFLAEWSTANNLWKKTE